MDSNNHTNKLLELRHRFLRSKHLLFAGGEDPAKLLELLAVQLMNDFEQERLNYLAHAEQLRRQAAAEEAKAQTCIAHKSALFNLINRFIEKQQEVQNLEAELDLESREELNEDEQKALKKLAEKQSQSAMTQLGNLPDLEESEEASPSSEGEPPEPEKPKEPQEKSPSRKKRGPKKRT